MRVGLICPYSLSVPGGVQGQVMALARSLRARGHEARVLAPCDGPPPATFVTPLGASVPQDTNGSVAPIAPDPAAMLRTIRALWDEDFDVLHIHEPLVPGPSLTAVLLKPSPMVGTFHAAGSQPAYAILAPIADWAASRLDARVTVSDDARALVEPHMRGPWTAGFNGIERGRFQTASPWPTEGPTVLFIGRHEPRKGLEVLLDALGQMEDDVRIWVAGVGEHTPELRERFGNPRIEWLGRIDDDERDRRMAGADVFCAPSLGGESFGVILLEAMAAGTAVVASDIPGYARVAEGPLPMPAGAELDGSEAGGEVGEVAVTPGPAAVLVPPGDPGALAAALRSVLRDPGRAGELRRAGAVRSAAFDMERLCDLYLDIYAGVVAAHA